MNEAVVQHVVDVVRQTVNARAANFFDTLSTTVVGGAGTSPVD
jgi:hypothetical protein